MFKNIVCWLKSGVPLLTVIIAPSMTIGLIFHIAFGGASLDLFRMMGIVFEVTGLIIILSILAKDIRSYHYPGFFSYSKCWLAEAPNLLKKQRPVSYVNAGLGGVSVAVLRRLGYA